jgi:hypothetical protein
MGAKFKMDWRDMEPDSSSQSNRVYDFSVIRDACNRLAADNKYLVIMLRHKTFSSSQKAAPRWIENAGGAYSWTSGTGNPRHVAKIWLPWVEAAWVDLIQALAAEFDSNPYFEGVQFEETAGSGIDAEPVDQTQYSHCAWYSAVEDINQAAKQAFSRALVWQQANWDRGGAFDMVDLFHQMEIRCCGIGAPDFYKDENKTPATSLFKSWSNRIPISSDSQRTQKLWKGWTPNDAYLEVIDRKIHHFMWHRGEDWVPTSGPWGDKWGWTEIDNMLNNPPGGHSAFYITTRRPDNLKIEYEIVGATAGSNPGSTHRAYDNEIETRWQSASGADNSQNWVDFDLGSTKPLSMIRLYNDSTTFESNVEIFIDGVHKWRGDLTANQWIEVTLEAGLQGRHVKVDRDNPYKLRINEIKIWGYCD